MLAEIGIMVGLYIVTRMLSYLTRSQERRESVVVKILSVITIIVTVLVVLDLFLRGTEPSIG